MKMHLESTSLAIGGVSVIVGVILGGFLVASQLEGGSSVPEVFEEQPLSEQTLGDIQFNTLTVIIQEPTERGYTAIQGGNREAVQIVVNANTQIEGSFQESQENNYASVECSNITEQECSATRIVFVTE